MHLAAPCFVAALLIGSFCVALVRAESTYAGDRDVRFLNCAVPCEFECSHRDVPLSDLVLHSHVRSVWQRPGPREPVDLFPHGKREYTRTLLAALEAAYSLLVQTGSETVVRTRTPTPPVKAIPSSELLCPLRAMQWDCEENCRYECMMVNSMNRFKNNEEQVHYFGKWPFTRVLGVQEFFSSIFSLLNGLPYVLFMFSSPVKGLRTGTQRLWQLHSAVFAFTWSQSALFHARDTPRTEALDYHGATLGLSASLICAIVANLPRRWHLRQSICLACMPVLTFWLGHVLYLTYVVFDYGYNMGIAVSLGIGTSIAWIVWAARYQQTCPFAWKVLVATLGPYLVLPLELMDFPPLFGLLDAHSLWHLGTIPMVVMWISFLRDYLQCEADSSSKEL